MRLKPFVALTLVLSFSPTAWSGVAKAGDTIQGAWLPSTVELGGKMFPDEIRKITKLVAEGPNKGKTIPAIYERDGDTLRVCYNLSGKNRPTEFKTKAGAQLFLVTCKREKP
jgi:hypothetical protein